MVEVLLVLTLVAAASTAGLLAFFLARSRNAERETREELSRTLATFSQTLTTQMGTTATVQNAQFETLRGAVEQQLGRIQQDNSAKLEQMRQTVDEKLHATLEKRLSESFKQVSERLELVHKGLGEMQTLATGVGDLKRVLSNVKTRGVFGEAQLAALLEQVMAPEQYEKNVATRPGSNARVEFAIKLPGSGDTPVLLPIDAKFPQEDYQRLQAALEAGDLLAAELAGKALEARVKLEARSIAEKYIAPPNTTDFALLYLPFEGLFAEVLRRPGLFDYIQREWRVTICGPDQPAGLSEQPADGIPHAGDPAAFLGSLESARHGQVGVRQVRRGAGQHQAATPDRRQHHRSGRGPHAPDRAQAERRGSPAGYRDLAGRPAAGRQSRRHAACSQVTTGPNGAATSAAPHRGVKSATGT
jgi:hypothetical protein